MVKLKIVFNHGGKNELTESVRQKAPPGQETRKRNAPVPQPVRVGAEFVANPVKGTTL
jgi:hypothetical protein